MHNGSQVLIVQTVGGGILASITSIFSDTGYFVVNTKLKKQSTKTSATVAVAATVDLIPLNHTASTVVPANNITSILVYDQKPSQELVVLLNHMHASEKWVVIKLHVDDDIASSFRVIKVPCLVMYNSQQEETARVFGEQNILDLVQKVVE